MERKSDQCKTFGGSCAYQEAQQYERALKENFPQSGFLKFIFFVPMYVADTRRLNLIEEANACKKCPHKPKNLR